MFRATTPKHIFYFRVDPSQFRTILITYSQHGEIVLEKHKSDLTINEESAGTYRTYLRLTQQESNLFMDGNVDVQIRVITEDGDALASEIKKLKVQDVLNDEVLE